MALFERKRDISSAAPLYTVGANKTLLVVGLGNPGKEHVGTRHNVGFEVVEEFSKNNDFPNWIAKKDLKCEIATHRLGEARVVLVKPTTFMNDSGQAVQAAQHFYRVYNQDTLVVYDELAILFGQIRTRVGGSDAGHNGVKSLISHVSDDFGRLRIGIGSEISKNKDAADFVLSKFTREEETILAKILREASALISEYIFSGELPHETRKVM